MLGGEIAAFNIQYSRASANIRHLRRSLHCCAQCLDVSVQHPIVGQTKLFQVLDYFDERINSFGLVGGVSSDAVVG